MSKKKIFSSFFKEKSYILVIALLVTNLFSLNLNAKTINVDSLENLLQQNLHDTININILTKLVYNYQVQGIDKSIEYANQLLTLGQKRSHKKSIATAYYLLGYCYDKKNYEIDTIIKRYQESMHLAIEINDTKLKIQVLIGEASVYGKIGYTDKAIALHQAALKIAENTTDKIQIVKTLSGIGYFLIKNNRPEAAKNYYLRALQLSKELNSERYIAYMNGNIGAIYYQEGQLDSALVLFKEILTYSEKNQDQYGISRALANIGIIYCDKNEYIKAKTFLTKAYNLALEFNYINTASLALTSITDNYYKQGNYKKTIEAAKKGLTLEGENGDMSFKIDFYEDLSKSYEKIQNYKLALQYEKHYNQLRDSLFNIDKNKQIEELSIQYEVAQKEAENKQLKAGKEKQAVINKLRNSLILITTLLALLMTVIAIMQRRTTNFKRQQNKLLEQKVAERTRELSKTSLELVEIKNIQILEEAKTRFFANISHEFRTPLTLIQGPLSTLLDNNRLITEDKNMVKRALHNSKQLLRLIGQVLDLTKLDSNQLNLNQKEILFYPFVKQLISNFEAYIQSKNIILKTEYQAKTGLLLAVDTDKIEKVINNYLSNAIKFTPKNGTITVTIKDFDNRIQLIVKDTGIGIAEDKLESIFKRFYQVKNNDPVLFGQANDYTIGTGIGLSLCKDYARLMNGKAWAESPNTSGKGSTFYFEFEKNEILKELDETQINIIQQNTQENTNQTYLTTENIKLSKRDTINTILIVEDNYDLRDFIKTLLMYKYAIITAENGQEALDQLNMMDQLPSLIISDVMMPVIDGFQLLEKLKSSDTFRHIPIMMLTARTEMQDKLRALRFGVDDYMIKPFDNNELLTRADNLIFNFNSRVEVNITKPDDKVTINTVSHSVVDNEWLQELEQIITSAISDFNLNAEIIADDMNISRSKLFRKIKQITGLTLNEYIKEIRLQTARKMIETSEVFSTKEVAYSIGYKSVNYFAQAYEKRFGKRPSELL